MIIPSLELADTAKSSFIIENTYNNKEKVRKIKVFSILASAATSW